MAWRGFRFGIQHLFRDRGYSNIEVNSASTIATGDFVSYCFDERTETMTFTAVSTNHWVGCDTGATPIPVSRIVIPAGHGCTDKRIKVQEDGDGDGTDYPSPVDRKWIDHADDSLIDYDLDVTTSERYVRVMFDPTPGQGATVNPTIAELWLTTTLTPTTGPGFRWRRDELNNVASLITQAGDRGDIQLGASQSVFEMEYPFVDDAADIAILDQLVDDVGMDQAFLLDPPFTGDDVVICKMARDPVRRYVQSATEGYSYSFQIIEQIV